MKRSFSGEKMDRFYIRSATYKIFIVKVTADTLINVTVTIISDISLKLIFSFYTLRGYIPRRN